MRDSPPTLYRTHMACPFIQICAPIYNGVSPCSTFAHHLYHQDLPHTGKITPRLHIDAICNQTSVLRGLDHSDRVALGRAEHVNSTNRSSPGVPRTGMRDRHDPRPVARTRPGSLVQGSGSCCAGCANEATSGPRSLAGRGWDPMGRARFG